MSVKEYVKAKWAQGQQLDETRLSKLVVWVVVLRERGIRLGAGREVRRYRRLLALPSNPLEGGQGPALSALVVVAAKDFPTLGLCVQGILANSGNPIAEVTIVAPHAAMHDAARIVQEILSVPVRVVDEDTLVSESGRSKLRGAFRERYGWVLQQILTVACVVESDAPGVLVVDADTILMQPRLLLDLEGRQILTPTFERTASYYEFLSGIGICSSCPENTFVPHWMLMQPEVLREALQAASQGSVDALIEQVIDLADRRSPSSVCVEYELYAQYLVGRYPDRVLLAKWGNTSLRSPSAIESAPGRLIQGHGEYGSVSVHSYLRSP